MCVMWSTADQYSEFEECTQTDQNFEIAGHDTLRFITVNPGCKTAHITDSGISYLLSEQS